MREPVVIDRLIVQSLALRQLRTLYICAWDPKRVTALMALSR